MCANSQLIQTATKLEQPITVSDGAIQFVVKQLLPNGHMDERLLSISERGFEVMDALGDETIEFYPYHEIKNWGTSKDDFFAFTWAPKTQLPETLTFRVAHQGSQIENTVRHYVELAMKAQLQQRQQIQTVSDIQYRQKRTSL